MAVTLTTTTGFSTLVQALIRAKAEQELRTSLPHMNPGNYVPGTYVKGTNLIRFARYADFSVVTTALTEGVAPTADDLSIDSQAFSATQYGATKGITDLAQMDSPHDLVAVAAERLAFQAARSMDVIVRDVLAAGTNVKYVTGSARTALGAGNIVTGALVKQMFWFLQKSNVPTFPDGTYRAIVSPDVARDIESDTASGGWIDAFKYTDNEPLLSGEVGRIFGVRFLVSSNAKVFAGGGSATTVDVHSSIFLGPDAYTVGDSQTLSSYFIPAGGDHTDPIGQESLLGWKVRFGAMLLDKSGARYVRLESGATAL